MYPNFVNPNQYNPMIQQRMNPMENQFSMYNQQSLYQQPQQPILKGRAVTSFDEVKAAMIDLDGSVFVFPDIGNKKIYTKQITLDGTAEFKVYNLSEPNTPPVIQTESCSETPDVIKAVTDLRNDIHTLESKFEQITKEVMENVQSISANNAIPATVIEQPLIQEGSRNGKWKK